MLALTLHTHTLYTKAPPAPTTGLCVIVINTISTIASARFPSFRGRRVLFILLQTMAAAEAPPRLQTAGGPSFGEGSFQPGDMVTIHNVTNLDDGLSAKVIAFDPDKNLYVVKDSMASIWGLRAEKLRPQKVLEMPEGVEWHEVPDGTVVPKGLEIQVDLSTGRKRARRMPQAVTAEPATRSGRSSDSSSGPTTTNEATVQQTVITTTGGHHEHETIDVLR